jgi:uncharacterized Ntn-hydrolase superfamily protein
MALQINTFSIAAYDPVENSWGVAVASKFLAVGAVVSWAQAGAGAVATQSFAKMTFGPDGLALMARGMSAREALDKLIAADALQHQRQVGMVDAQGGAAAHTGSSCYDWAGHKVGEGFTCQGNILAGPQVLEAMAETFVTARGELSDRLSAALLAGEEAGGDRRGKQSAAVLVVKPNGGYGGDNDRYLDLRVDDDPQSVHKLIKLVQTHHLYFSKPRQDEMLPITEELVREIQSWLLKGEYIRTEPSGNWDEDAKKAFWALVGNENLEERWSLETADQIDRITLDYLREKFGN